MELSSEMLVDLIINIANILILFFVVRKLLYKPVKKFMTERAERIEGEKLKAQKLAEESEQKKAEYDALLADCEEIKQQAKKDGELSGREEAHKLIEEASQKAAAITEKAKKQSEEDYAAMLDDARDDILSLALGASERILGREITPDDNKKCVEDFLAASRKQGEADA